MQDATEHFHYPELVGEPFRLELNFDTAYEHVTEVIALGERMSSVAVDNLELLEKLFSKPSWITLLFIKY